MLQRFLSTAIVRLQSSSLVPTAKCSPHILQEPSGILLSAQRFYAKGKDKKKDKTSKGKVEINENQLKEFINLEQLNGQMQKHLQGLKEDFVKNLSLRSTSGAIETLKVTVDGSEHELQELAQISRKNPKTVIINMIAFPQTIPDVLKSIEKSGMNLNPQQDGTTLFIPIPKVTKEHRENLSKSAKTLFVKCRDNIKDVQNTQIKKLKRKDDLSKDDIFVIQNQVTALADKYIAEGEKILATKQNELTGGN